MTFPDLKNALTKARKSVRIARRGFATSVHLKNWPADLSLPRLITNRLKYNSEAQQLIFTGRISRQDRKLLLHGSKDQAWREAIPELSQSAGLFSRVRNSLLAFFSNGGILICTPSHGSVEDSGQPVQFLARTLIQPDGDVITHVSEEIRNQPEVWQNHIGRLRQAVSRLRWFHKFLLGIQLSGIAVMFRSIPGQVIDLFRTSKMPALDGWILTGLLLTVLRPVVRSVIQSKIK